MVTAVDCQELLERLLVRIETQKDNSMPENNVEAAEAQDPDNNGTKEGTDSIGIAING